MAGPRSIPSFAAPADQAISELNTTPLIDVMLVLLIMFIITVPVATHKVPLDLPNGPPPTAEPVTHRLDLDAAGRISLNGAPVVLGQLRGRLQALGADDELQLRAEATTPYGRYNEVLAEVKRAGVTRLGTVGNERFAEALD